MIQIIKLCLDKPDKFERIILLLLKTLLTIWLLNSILYLINPNYVKGFSDAKNYTSLTFLTNFSPFYSAFYIVLFIITWLIVWYVISLWLTPIIFKIYSWIVNWGFFIPFFLVSFVRYCFDTKRKLLKPSNKIPYIPLFTEINQIFNNVMGSQVLYLIIEHEKSSLIKSRFFSYFTISVLLFIGYSFSIGKENFGVFYYISLTLFIFLGTILTSIDDLYNELQNQDLTILKVRLVNDLFMDMVDDTIKKHQVFGSLLVSKSKKRLVLSNEKSKKENEPISKIIIYRFLSSQYTDSRYLLKWLKEHPESNTKYLIISDNEPDLASQNFMVENGISYICCSNSEELNSGLHFFRLALRKNV